MVVLGVGALWVEDLGGLAATRFTVADLDTGCEAFFAGALEDTLFVAFADGVRPFETLVLAGAAAELAAGLPADFGVFGMVTISSERVP